MGVLEVFSWQQVNKPQKLNTLVMTKLIGVSESRSPAICQDSHKKRLEPKICLRRYIQARNLLPSRLGSHPRSSTERKEV